MSTPDLSRFDLDEEIPLTARALRWFGRGYGVVFNPITRMVWGLGMLVVLAAVTSAKLRTVQPSWMFAVAIVATLMVLGWVLAYLASLAVPRLFYGKPVFGRLGGPRAGAVRVAIAASQGLDMQFAPEDQAVMDTLTAATRANIELMTRDRWNRLRSHSDSESDETVEADWHNVWNRLLQHRLGDGKFENFLSADSNPVRSIAAELVGVNALFDPLYRLSTITLVLLGYQALLSAAALLTTLQVTLVLSFILSALVYATFSFDLLATHVVWVGPRPPEPLNSELKVIEGRSILPARVRITGRYIAALRNAFARSIFIGTAVIAVVGIAMLLISLATGLVFLRGSSRVLVSWYEKQMLLIAALPVALVLGHYIMFFLLQNLRVIGMAALCAAISAGLPPAVTYLWSGHLPDTTSTLITSGGTAVLAGVLGAVVARIQSATADAGPNVRIAE